MPNFIEKTKQQHPNKKISFWFQDESRFGNKTRISPIWCDKKEKAVIPIQNGFSYSYIFGAINIENGDHVGLVTNGVDTEFMNSHLSLISKEVNKNDHAIVIMDQAGFHLKSSSLEIPTNISILELPPYSPELNPMEIVWLKLKARYLKNRIIEAKDNLFDIGCDVWNKLTNEMVISISKGHKNLFIN